MKNTKLKYKEGWHLDIMEKQGKMYFLMDDLSLKEKVVEDGVCYTIPKRIPWPIPKWIGDEVRVDPPESDYLEIVWDFIHDHVVLEDEVDYTYLSLWVMLTYLQDRIDNFPYVHFRGMQESGKTRALEVLEQLAYRAVITPSPTEAILAREIDLYRMTILIDQVEQKTMQERGIEDILCAGYRRGQVFPRVREKRSEGLEFFSCASMRAFASRLGFEGPLGERCYVINMRKATRKVPFYIDKERAAQIRGELLAWSKTFKYDRDIESPLLEVTPSRAIELLQPMWPIVASLGKTYKEEFQDVIEKTLRRHRETKGEGEEAEIIEGLYDYLEQYGGDEVTARSLADYLNQEAGERRWNARSLGKRLAMFGFESRRTARTVIWKIDAERLDALMREHQIIQEGTQKEKSV